MGRLGRFAWPWKRCTNSASDGLRGRSSQSRKARLWKKVRSGQNSSLPQAIAMTAGASDVLLYAMVSARPLSLGDDVAEAEAAGHVLVNAR